MARNTSCYSSLSRHRHRAKSRELLHPELWLLVPRFCAKVNNHTLTQAKFITFVKELRGQHQWPRLATPLCHTQGRSRAAHRKNLFAHVEQVTNLKQQRSSASAFVSYAPYHRTPGTSRWNYRQRAAQVSIGTLSANICATNLIRSFHRTHSVCSPCALVSQ